MEPGDVIEYGGELGVVVCTTPPVMRCTAFHSYVPLVRPSDVVDTGRRDTSNVNLPAAVRRRIVAHLRATVARGEEEEEECTGG